MNQHGILNNEYLLGPVQKWGNGAKNPGATFQEKIGIVKVFDDGGILGLC